MVLMNGLVIQMNKSAKEMFEELGYEFEQHPYSITALIVYRKDLEYIYFDADKKIVIRRFIDMKLLQAINQQCKELGWLDE